MSADLFYNAIPPNLRGNERVEVAYFVYYLVEEQKQVAATAGKVDQCYRDCDIPPPTRTAQMLSEGTNGKRVDFVKVPGGYRLERSRKEAIAKSLGARKDVVQTSAELRALEALFSDPDTKAFLKEAIDCFEAGANRAAVIMVWLLTFDHFLNYIFNSKLTEFNRRLGAVTANNPKARITRITKIEDFEEIGESDIITYCRSENIITNGVKNSLDEGLKTRNSAAHPSNVTIARSKTIAVIEDLVTNVIKKI